MELRLFDLHCDTPTELYGHCASLDKNSQHVSLEKASAFSRYVQIMAIWSPWKMPDNVAFANFHKVADYLMNEFERLEDKISFIRTGEGLDKAASKQYTALLAVEDARILAGVPERLRVLYARGVRFLTAVWGGESCIGGAHNTNVGLTDFGKRVIRDCFEMGITPDLSHASVKTAAEILEIASEYGKPVIATHSDSYSVCPHSRNLRDSQFEAIKKSGGIVGICLCPEHLRSEPEKASLEDIIKHIEHYLSLGGENNLAMGSDLDGTDLPRGFTSVADLSKIADGLARLNYTDALIDKIFFANAERFIKGIL